ncbi:hypothetical protein B0H66DRAFT_555613 [Apodospora peruviana]|uniref:Alpha/beta hydrolase fold-3 domain-containing protein n=1 Tax=Apodospora peruviana TaxID=516989 RepID=A0AAE0M892_9PEZI|nr:hypothetical protein B0H66DRAFT_555613 [Apodospora peruviana]
MMATSRGARAIVTCLRLKLIAIALRFFIKVTSRKALKRDQLLADEIPIASQPVRIPAGGDPECPTHYIDVVLYYPTSLSLSSSLPATRRPILINWHGSGWVFPLLGSDALFLKRVARDCGMFVLDADYRKGPENPFPCALQDVEDVLHWAAVGSSKITSCSLDKSGWK